MPTPAECRYTETHEWLDLDGDLVTVGITQYAADELTDVTYVEMKPEKTTILPGDSVGEVESVKTTSDVFTPVGGEIVAVNQRVETARYSANPLYVQGAGAGPEVTAAGVFAELLRLAKFLNVAA